MSRESVEFALKCVVLEQEFKRAMHKEPNNRVWIAVLMHKIIEICNEQEDPEAAFTDVIEALKIEREECED